MKVTRRSPSGNDYAKIHDGQHGIAISADPLRGGVQVLITGRYGFEQMVRFSINEDPVVIGERVRETLEAE